MQAESDILFEGWRARLATLGKRVSLRANDGSIINGVAEDVTSGGALVVRDLSGKRLNFQAGDVTQSISTI